MKRIFLLLFVVLFSQSVLGAVISGTVYDMSLNPVKNIVVLINTTPHQQYLSQDGTYVFNVLEGQYTLSSRTYSGELVASEEILVVDEGEYVIDLFLFLDLDRELEEIAVEDISFSDVLPQSTRWLDIGLLVVLVLILVYFGTRLVNVKKQDNEELNAVQNKIIGMLEKNDIMTQKEVRKALPFSEAKVSMLINELVEMGYIKKTKRGRGNVLRRIR